MQSIEVFFHLTPCDMKNLLITKINEGWRIVQVVADFNKTGLATGIVILEKTEDDK